MNTQELAWAAGLFDGEGTVVVRRKSKPGRIHLALAMSDEESVRRFHASLGGIGNVCAWSPPSRGDHRKPMWMWQSDRFEHIQATAAFLWQWLGRRNQMRLHAALGGTTL